MVLSNALDNGIDVVSSLKHLQIIRGDIGDVTLGVVQISKQPYEEDTNNDYIALMMLMNLPIGDRIITRIGKNSPDYTGGMLVNSGYPDNVKKDLSIKGYDIVVVSQQIQKVRVISYQVLEKNTLDVLSLLEKGFHEMDYFILRRIS